MPSTGTKIFLIICSFIAIFGMAAAIFSTISTSNNKDSSATKIVKTSDSNKINNITKPQVKAIETTSIQNDENIPVESAFINDIPPVSFEEGITAKAYIVGNLKTGKIYFSRKSDQVLPVASMSKLITVIAGIDTIASSTIITIAEQYTKLPPDSSNLQTDEKFTFGELLYPMLMNSSNVAAEAVASSTDLQKFLDLMSSYAWEVGMPHAFFADPTGLSPKNRTTAREMFALSQYLYKSRPDILKITRNEHIDIATTTDHGSHSFDSTHPFVKDPRFLGGKTGRTLAAGETMMTLMDMGKGQIISFIVMGSQYGERESDTNKLIKKFENL